MDHVTSHDELAQSRLPLQYRDKANIHGLISAIAGQAQQLEDALWDVAMLRTIDEATGGQLDVLASILGADRADADDDVLRLRLRAHILLNRSSGTAPEILEILALVSDPSTVIELREYFPAAIIVSVVSEVQPPGWLQVISKLLRLAKGAAVRAELLFSSSTSPTTFRFDSGPGFDQGHIAGVL